MALLSYAITTVDRQKDFQGLTGSTYDTVLERLINSATDYIEMYLGGRRFKQTTYTNEEYDGTGTDKLVLKQWPIVSGTTTTLQYRTTTQNRDEWESEESENFKIKDQDGILIYVAGGKFQDYPLHYRVTYTAGYNYDNAATFLSDVGMGDIEYACWVLVKNYFENKQKAGDIQTESIGNYSVSFNTTIQQNPEVRDILKQYSRPMAF